MNKVDELLGRTAPIVNDLIVSERKNVVISRIPFDRSCFSNPFLILRSDFFTGDNYTIKPFLSGSFTYIAYTSITIAGLGM